MGELTDPEDERMNNILATGGIWGALSMNPNVHVEQDYDDNGQAVNSMVVHLEFLKSPYRITIERVPDGG